MFLNPESRDTTTKYQKPGLYTLAWVGTRRKRQFILTQSFMDMLPGSCWSARQRGSRTAYFKKTNSFNTLDGQWRHHEGYKRLIVKGTKIDKYCQVSLCLKLCAIQLRRDYRSTNPMWLHAVGIFHIIINLFNWLNLRDDCRGDIISDLDILRSCFHARWIIFNRFFL